MSGAVGVASVKPPFPMQLNISSAELFFVPQLPTKTYGAPPLSTISKLAHLASPSPVACD